MKVKNILSAMDEVKKYKKPKVSDKNNYLGIEIEFVSKKSIESTIILVAAMGLADRVNIGSDSSIECSDDWDDEEFGIEARILVKEKDLVSTLTDFGEVIKGVSGYVNESCGLHVHIDMRHRDKKLCAAKLALSQDLLFNIVPGHRKKNDYCIRTEIEEVTGPHNTNKYRAINTAPSTTIEVRLHEGTVDMKAIINWCSLLLGIIKSEVPVLSTTYKSVGAIPTKVKTYATNRYKKYSKEPARDPDDY